MIIWWSYMIMCIYIYVCNICNICNIWLYIVIYMITCDYVYMIIYVRMIIYDYIWLYMIIYDYIWLYMIIYDYIWLYMIIYDYIWLYMYEYIWLFTVQLHINCLTKKTYIYIYLFPSKRVRFLLPCFHVVRSTGEGENRRGIGGCTGKVQRNTARWLSIFKRTVIYKMPDLQLPRRVVVWVESAHFLDENLDSSSVARTVAQMKVAIFSAGKGRSGQLDLLKRCLSQTLRQRIATRNAWGYTTLREYVHFHFGT